MFPLVNYRPPVDGGKTVTLRCCAGRIKPVTDAPRSDPIDASPCPAGSCRQSGRRHSAAPAFPWNAPKRDAYAPLSLNIGVGVRFEARLSCAARCAEIERTTSDARVEESG